MGDKNEKKYPINQGYHLKSWDEEGGDILPDWNK